MPAIPEVDIAVNLIDTGYALPIATDGGGSTFGAFAIFGIAPVGIPGLNAGDVKNVAHFPEYGSGGPSPAPTNYALGATRSDETVITSGSEATSASFHYELGAVLVFDITNLFTTGKLEAKALQAWPGTIDYTTTGLVPLTISNQSIGMSLRAAQAIILDDASYAFCIGGEADGSGILAAGAYILIVKPDLSTPAAGWLPDVMNGTFGLFASCTWLGGDGINYQVDNSTLPTLTTYTVTYNFTTGQAASMLGTGDVSSDAANAFGALGAPNTGAAYLTMHGVFGIDAASGNNTGCWYCALDCSAFGRVSFAMPDASLGPSSDPSVWNVFQGGSFFGFGEYPQVDDAGNWWWIRLPLCDGAGNLILEPLTSEVYKSGAAPAATGGLMGTHVAFQGSGQFGGTK